MPRSYTGKMSVNARGTEFVSYDDSNDALGITTGQARRELGLVVFGAKTHGNCLTVEAAVPRVLADGRAAQFRPRKVAQAMLSLYREGKTANMAVLRGAAQLVPGGKVQLRWRGGDKAAVVFEAYRANQDQWAVRYRHPLSCLQAFNIAVAALHNEKSALLDLLPPLEEVAHAPPLHPTIALVADKALEAGTAPVYAVHVHGARIFCGLRSGHVQQWATSLIAPPTAHEWRAHSGCVYAILVVGEVLVTASADALLRVWELRSMQLVATLAGHAGKVRALAAGVEGEPHIVFSASNDLTVRVWDLKRMTGGGVGDRRGSVEGPPQVLRGHRFWVRALVMSADGRRLCSAAKDVRVWDAKTRLQLHVLPVGCWVYSLAVCATSMGKAQTDTLYAGCKDGKIRSWKLGQLAASESGGAGALNGHEAAVRSVATLGAVLYSGDADGVVQAWDLSTLPTVHRTLPGHAAAVRAVAADPVTHFLYTGSEDTTIRVWHEGPPDAGASDMLDGAGGGRKGSLLGGRGRRRSSFGGVL